MHDRKFSFDWQEAVVPAVALAFVIAFLLQTTDAPMAAIYWPLITACGFLFFWLLTVKKYILRWNSREAEAVSVKQSFILFDPIKRRVSLILAASAGYLLLMPHLGFTLINFIFMMIVFRSLGSHKWGQNIAVAAGISLFLHISLVVLMKQELPRLTIGGLSI